MFKSNNEYSIVTAILPHAASNTVVDTLIRKDDAAAFSWKARGTLLREDRWSRWVPPVGPLKTVFQMLVPQQEVDALSTAIIETGNLHRQATGAVFSTPCDHAYLGTEFHTWPSSPGTRADTRQHSWSENLSIIYCTVGHAASDRVARAAVNAGAHGPVIYYGEGRGLRDRIGWLRITKEHEQEILMVIAEESQVEEVFNAMAKAGEFHKPGRGLMYRLSIDKGMFNLPSSYSQRGYTANMQQIINAIDHLSGHNHWRDQSVYDVGGAGKGVGLDALKQTCPSLDNKVCLSAIIKRDQSPGLVDLMLDSGAPGLNMTHAKFIAAEKDCLLASARLNTEYSLMRSIVDQSTAEHICATVDESAEDNGIRDLCLLVNSVPRLATYVPGRRDYRLAPETTAA
ncbi:MAG: hypothetical protein AAF385_06560 [Pseudomonadota bacterium]